MSEQTTTLRDERQRRRLTQADLAQRSGMSLRTVQAIEAGAHAPHPTRRRLLAALGLCFSEHKKVFGAAPSERKCISTSRVLEDEGDAA